MDLKFWERMADKIQDAAARLSRALLVGNITSLLFLLVATQIPAFPVEQVFLLQFYMVCLSVMLVGSIGAVNWMFTFFAIQQLGGKDD